MVPLVHLASAARPTRGHLAMRRLRPATLAAELPTPYDIADPSTPQRPTPAPALSASLARDSDAELDGTSLRDAVARVAEALADLHHRAVTTPVGAGEVGALLDLLEALDVGQAALLALTGRVDGHGLAQRATGLSLESLLAGQSPLPRTERRRLLRTVATLRSLPGLRTALEDRRVPATLAHGLCSQARPLDAAGTALFDALFAVDRPADAAAVSELRPDELLDEVTDTSARLRPDRRRREEAATVERRFLSLQPRLDGSLTGYFELDPEGGATLLEALHQAAPPPAAGPNDVTRHALDDPEGNPVVPRSWRWRRRGRQHADALVLLAEEHLAGSAATRPSRRPRPRLLVWTDLATLLGRDELGAQARLLWAAVGPAPRLTPDTLRRLGSDADLRFVLHEGGRVLGTTAPVATIPTPLREAIHARDRGCRFPGCSAPVHHTDLHHVVPRHEGGATLPDNLVALCRRHHTAVTLGRWQLGMTADAVVTVRRGRRRATSHPPQQPPRAGPTPIPLPRQRRQQQRRPRTGSAANRQDAVTGGSTGEPTSAAGTPTAGSLPLADLPIGVVGSDDHAAPSDATASQALTGTEVPAARARARHPTLW